ncbi:MAG TPA: HAD family hydrolase [Bacilli bacterium]|nr:HAD family hydrolase [Bacilli bacterium]
MELQTKPNLIIWDIDGTLTYYCTVRYHYKDVLIELGIEPKEEYVDEILMTIAKFLEMATIEHCFSQDYFSKYNETHLYFLRDSGISGTEFSNKGKELQPKYLLSHIGMYRLLDFIYERTEITQVAFSNWFLDVQEEKLRSFGLLPFISKIYTPETIFAKPSTEGFNSILEAEGIEPKKAIMIGDSAEDLGASGAGIPTILIDHFGDKQDLYSQAGEVARTPNDIKELILKK